MTPSQLEHLKLIDAHLERLLAIAEKRTPGEWLINQTQPTTICCGNREPWPAYKNAEPDAAFIASCSGNAEAGWRAARSAIAAFQEECPHGCLPHCPHHRANEKHVESILAAFPLESLKTP